MKSRHLRVAELVADGLASGPRPLLTVGAGFREGADLALQVLDSERQRRHGLLNRIQSLRARSTKPRMRRGKAHLDRFCLRLGLPLMYIEFAFRWQRALPYPLLDSPYRNFTGNETGRAALVFVVSLCLAWGATS